MIIQNGTIELKESRGAGLDYETGHPVKAKEDSWGCPIPCQFIPSVNRMARTVNGEHYVQTSYEILIEEHPICSEQLRLRDRRGGVIGEYSILSATPLEAVDEVRILV